MEEVILKTFIGTEDYIEKRKDIDCNLSGSTATIVFICNNQVLNIDYSYLIIRFIVQM